MQKPKLLNLVGQKICLKHYSNELTVPLKNQIKRVAEQYKNDIKERLAKVYLPYTLKRKYPHRELAWQYLFSS